MPRSKPGGARLNLGMSGLSSSMQASPSACLIMLLPASARSAACLPPVAMLVTGCRCSAWRLSPTATLYTPESCRVLHRRELVFDIPRSAIPSNGSIMLEFHLPDAAMVRTADMEEDRRPAARSHPLQLHTVAAPEAGDRRVGRVSGAILSREGFRPAGAGAILAAWPLRRRCRFSMRAPCGFIVRGRRRVGTRFSSWKRRPSGWPTGSPTSIAAFRARSISAAAPGRWRARCRAAAASSSWCLPMRRRRAPPWRRRPRSRPRPRRCPSRRIHSIWC